MHLADAQIKSSWRVVRTRLYFTSESHLHALLTALRAPAQGDVADDHAAADAAAADAASLVDGEAAKWLSQIPELSYLSHMVFRLWEDKSMDPADPRRHMVELSFSPGTPLEYNTEESPGRADDGGDDSDDEFDVPTEPLQRFAYVTSQRLEEYFAAAPTASADEALAAATAKYDGLTSALVEAARVQKSERQLASIEESMRSVSDSMRLGADFIESGTIHSVHDSMQSLTESLNL
mmetsp:Transcript_9749/g.33705  ORF Transcript_9749/g.33705 Transcript_9749/m.33705 type:complete len:236 (-) Transcript_9749:27-734(-)